MERRELVELLVRHLAAGRLGPTVVANALKALADPVSSPPGLAPIARALEDLPAGPFDELARRVAQLRADAAREVYRIRTSGGPLAIPEALRADLSDLPLDVPPGWATGMDACLRVRRAIELERDLRFLHGQDIRGLAIEQAVEAERTRIRDELARTSGLPRGAASVDALAQRLELDPAIEAAGLTGLLAALRQTMARDAALAAATAAQAVAAGPDFAWPPGVDEGALLTAVAVRASAAGDSPAALRPWLDRLLAWPSDAAGELIATLCRTGWAQERAALGLLLRHGGVRAWSERRMWLDELRRAAAAHAEALAQRPAEALLVWSRLDGRADPALVAALERFVATRSTRPDVDDFVRRWRGSIDPSEANLLLGIPLTAAEEIPTLTAAPEPRGAAGAATPVGPPIAPPRPVRPSEPAPRPAWQEHVHGFFSENGYLVAGIAMVLAGCSLLAYFTWDHHWLLRYTIMPALLGAFTWALARLGRILERRDAALAGTGAALRGAAIALLPMNFMTIALLAGDPGVTGVAKLAAMAVMGAVYAGMFGAGLVRWCADVQPALGRPLGGTLLALCALVMVGPIAREYGGVDGDGLRMVLGVGFHLGFALVAGCLGWFAWRVLTPEMAREERVPAFVVATLAIAFVEVFAWVHGWARGLPHVHTYSVLVVGVGALVLVLERRLLELRAREVAHVGESYLGYALVLTGASMGLGEPLLRPLALAAAGAVWLWHAATKRHAAHDAIGLALCSTAAATVAYHPDFPALGRPWVWLALAFAASVLAGRRVRRPTLAAAAAGFVPLLALATVTSASTEQWRHAGPPLHAAAALLLVAVALLHRARDESEPAYVDVAAIVAAMALPYLGCVDLERRTLQGNSMAFGLTALGTAWLALCALAPRSIVRQSRSTVLIGYGALAVAAMVLRVTFEVQEASPSRLQLAMDYGGPLAMTALLVVATYTSRSLVPAAMAVVIAIILFPQLKERYGDTLEKMGWGTGLGGATSALGILGACFALRSWRALAALGEGDRYLGRHSYPLRRPDYTLFTWPLAAAAVFLMVRTDTETLGRHLWRGGVGTSTAVALALTGLGWWLVAVYHRAHRAAVGASHLGWIWVAVGIGFLPAIPELRTELGVPTDLRWRWHETALAAVVAVQLAYGLFRALGRRRPWAGPVLAAPAFDALSVGVPVLAVALMAEVGTRDELARTWPIAALLAIQLAGLALATRFDGYGALLGGLGWAWLAATTLPLAERWQLWRIHPGLALGVQLAIALAGRWRARLGGLYRPLGLFAALWCILPVWVLVEPLAVREGALPAARSIALLAAAALATGWANRFGPGLLLASLLAYVAVFRGELDVGGMEARWTVLGTPWRLGALAASLALAGAVLRAARRSGVRWIQGPAPLAALEAPYSPWLQVPSVALAVAAAALHTAGPGWRDEPLQLLAPALGALALGVVAWGWRQVVWLPPMLALLGLAFVHAARVWAGPVFEEHGLGLTHLIGTGLAATVLAGSGLRRLIGAPTARAVLRHSGLWIAGAMIALSWASYAVDPDLSTIRWERFIVSGAMIWLAGRYFRAVARRPEGEFGPAACTGFEGLYHAALALALACFALAAFPVLRHPNTALAALVLPALWFHARCELARTPELRTRYRSSAATLAFLILGLYSTYGAVQVVFFPLRPPSMMPYHTSSPLVVLVALSMLRLHRLGGTPWLALYSGVALIVGSYFAVTWAPGLSPFEHPLAGAWCALALGHAWTVAGDERSPLRTALLRLGGIDPATWVDLRVRLGPCLLALTHAAVAWGLAFHAGAPVEAVGLLAATSTLWFHHAWRRDLAPFVAVGLFELLAAVHAGMVIRGAPIAPDEAVWAVLGLWAALLAVHRVTHDRAGMRDVAANCGALAAIVAAHVVLRHRPWSVVGLGAVAAGGVLAVLVPRRERSATAPTALALAQLPLVVPAWLAYFATAPFAQRGSGALWEPRAWLALAGALLGTGAAALAWQRVLHPVYSRAERRQPRLLDHTLAWLGQAGHDVLTVLLVGASILLGGVHVAHAMVPLPPDVAAAMLALYAGCVAGWVREAGVRHPLGPIVMAQLGIAGALAVLRAVAIRLLGHWDPIYDIWALLGIGLALTAAMDAVGRRSAAMRAPFAVTYYLLPVAGIAWCVTQRVGTDAVMLVLGVHAMLFGYAGRGRRDSPHSVCALLGATAFVVVGFYGKLGLEVIHAYTIPVGIAMLALVQLYADRTDRTTRDAVRFLALVGMIGPSTWYVLVDPRHPIAFHLVLLGLALALAAAGSVLRVKVFIAAGLLGLLADTATIVVRSLLEVEHGVRMSVLGGLVLALGAGLVGGAVYYKTHRELVGRWLAAIRERLGAWD